MKKWLTMLISRLDHSKILSRDMESLLLNMTLPVTTLQCKPKQLAKTQVETNKIVAAIVTNEETRNETPVFGKSTSHHTKRIRQLIRNEKVKRVSDKIKAARNRGLREGLTDLDISQPPLTDP